MLERMNSNQTIKSWKGNLPFESLYTAGIAGEEFLRGLKDKGVFLATRCNACNQTYAPARMFCESCFAELKEYIKVGDKGTVVTWTRGHRDLDGRRLEKPVTLAAIQLEGATTVFIHRLAGSPSIGQKVKAVLEPKNKRKGSILDVKHFEAV